MSRSIVLAVLLLGACDAYDSDLGATPFLCGDDAPRCPDGYSCMMDALTGKEICVSSSGSLSGDFDCNDDSANEPNDELAAATATSLDEMADYSIDGQAVCPAGDKDVFAIVVHQMNTNVDVDITFETGGADLQMALLNAGGIPISVGMGETGSRTLHAGARNLPAGSYYISVSAPVSDTISVNNYTLTATAVPSP